MKTLDIANIFSLTTKRVTDLVLEQSRQAFWQSGIELDAKMISIITLIHQTGPLTSTSLARQTGLSRQLVESRLRRLVKDRYLDELKDPTDLRRRVYNIKKAKKADVVEAIEMAASFERVYNKLWQELKIDVHQALRDLETALIAEPILARLNSLDSQLMTQKKKAKKHV